MGVDPATGLMRRGTDYTGDVTALTGPLTGLRLDGNWVSGRCRATGWHVQLQVFSTGSIYGIAGGRVSRLFVAPDPHNWLDTVAAFERGWDREPSDDATRTLCLAIVRALDGPRATLADAPATVAAR